MRERMNGLVAIFTLGLILLFMSAFLAAGQVGKDAAMQGHPAFFREAEDSLRKMATRIVEKPDEKSRFENNQLFFSSLCGVLEKDGSFNYPFDSLQTVSMLMAPDSSFRIITWYVPYTGQRFEYFGIIQRKEKAGENGGLIMLQDSTTKIQGAVFEELSADKWFGAYYYELIHDPFEGGDHYTLLGWKGDNPHTRKRVIEPLWFRDERPVFGREVFRIGQHDPRRIVFEYSARASMSLLYARHPIKAGDAPVDMILFDRLSPGDESLRGQYRYYVPETNIFDALVFENGHWVFYPDVDARAPESGD